jgi:hypothetical protein
VPDVADRQLLAALRLSGAGCVMVLLAPPGLCGWSFLPGWSPSDPLTVSTESLSLPATLSGDRRLRDNPVDAQSWDGGGWSASRCSGGMAGNRDTGPFSRPWSQEHRRGDSRE